MSGSEVAVVGMSCRFPGAGTIDDFWSNLRDGTESIEQLSDEEMLANGVDAQLLEDSSYVKAGSFVDGLEMFDPSFFGMSPRDASIMDPQHRLFLECASDVLEYAGYDPRRFEGSIGLFGGCGMNLYLIRNLLTNPALVDSLGFWALRHLGNDKDFLATRVAYCLDLKGPVVNVQTACSTSLVAIHLACQSLLNGECEMALAGGVTVEIPHRQGYVYQEGEILSPDGHCRAFDDRAKGTVLGSGAGIVALRRLDDAVASRDSIHAVVKASAINNDGAGKVGFFAPSVDGHADVVLQALGLAEVAAESVSYVEAHGTGTGIGDPIEVRALTEAFRAGSSGTGFCGIGSVKTNIGHLDMAAGVAGFIKVVESLKHRQLPASLHFETPNQSIDFADSPFFVVDRLREWESADGTSRRAGISSLGVGGTNAHAILEEAPAVVESGSARPALLLVLSARSRTALDEATDNLSSHLRAKPETNIADAAYTLQVGRRAYDYRRAVICKNRQDAIECLESPRSPRVSAGSVPTEVESTTFLFSGQGSQYANMATGLFSAEPVFREELRRCRDILRPHLERDLLEIIFSSEGHGDGAPEGLSLTDTALTQPSLVAVEYALARQWMTWGIQPQSMLGHSIGEFTAACLAGVFTLEAVLPLVATRGRLMQQLPKGRMVAVSLPEKEVSGLLVGIDGACVAVQNAPSQLVVSGGMEAMTEFERRLAADFVPHQRLHTSHAFHSPMMDSILKGFAEVVSQLERRKPQIPFVSNVTGTWITDDEARDPAYWSQHLRQPVRFGDGLATILKGSRGHLLEVGPGKALATIARRHPCRVEGDLTLQSLPHPMEGGSDHESMLSALGQLWAHGAEVDWVGFNSHEELRRLPLPTYPFERQRCWVEPVHEPQLMPRSASSSVAEPERREPSASIDDWFWRPVWTESEPSHPSSSVAEGNWLVFADDHGFGDRFAEWLVSRSARAASDVPDAVGIVVQEPGVLASLSLQPCERRTPGSQEVEIRVHTAGLNFRDVMNALGAYPEGPVPLGSECVGTVVAAGDRVTEFAKGDEVLAIAPDTFRRYVTVDANVVVRKPSQLSFGEAAGVPVAYLTAHYALNQVARLSSGERVLIHAATGGVGMAAVRLAQAVGAEIFATAGSTDKRRLLEGLGVEHVFDSRSLDFADQILASTSNQGVDVVLNSLAGEFLVKSLSLLKPFGRFLEIGKTDIYQGTALGLEPFKRGLSFNSIDMEIVARERPGLLQNLLREVVDRVGNGQLPPLPARTFPVTRASDAFELMAKAGHTGKIVLEFEPQAPSVVTVKAGDGYQKIDAHHYVIDAALPEDYVRLLDELGYGADDTLRVAHLWSVGSRSTKTEGRSSAEDEQTTGFYSLLHLSPALARCKLVDLVAVSSQMQQVVGGESVEPIKATLLGPVTVIPSEFPNIQCRSVDISVGNSRTPSEVGAFKELTGEFSAECPSCAPGFPWTLDCERVLAGGVSKWGSQIKVRQRRREPGGRPEMLPGTAVGDGFRPGASARRCCVCCAARILSPCRGSWGSRRRGPRSGGISFWPQARPA